MVHLDTLENESSILLSVAFKLCHENLQGFLVLVHALVLKSQPK